MELHLTAKHVLITGATRGIGRAIAWGLQQTVIEVYPRCFAFELPESAAMK